MISYFSKGRKAHELGLSPSLCRLTGMDREEWMSGYKSYKPTKTEVFSVDELREQFDKNHLKIKEDGI